MKVLLKCLLVFGLMLLPFSISAQGQTIPLEQKADSLYERHEDKSALEIYQQILEKNPDNYEALWRISFLYSRIGNRFDDNSDKEEYFNKAIDWAEKALAVDSLDSQSNFVMAVAMGRKAMISGARERVAASREIKRYADRAIHFDSTNAGAWHVLGRWNFKVANLSWLERTAANTLFGGLPGNASNKQAAEHIERAISLNDNYVLYYYDLARVYKEMNNDKKAVSACKKAQKIPNLTPDDKTIKRDCRNLIKDLLQE